jgi:hypothetical protein
MKRILLVLLVLLGLQTQAQINICDSVTISGSQYQLTIEVNNINTIMYYWETTGPNGLFTLAEDSMTNQHSVYNVNPVTQMTYDTILTCANTNLTTCCWTFIWDGTMWLRMGAPSQITCDSITYWVDQSQGFNVGLDTSNIGHNPDSMEVYWQACTNGLCYAGQGMYAYFGQIMTTDTVKLCYDVMFWESGVLEVCTHCDSLIYDGNNWVLFSIGNTTSINELIFNRTNDGKIYDMLGREVTKIQMGQMYIRNNKKYIRVK